VDKIRYFLQQSWLLIVSAFCFGLLIAATNYALAPRIVQNRIDKLNSRARALLSEEAHLVHAVEIEIDAIGGNREKVQVYRAEVDGTCIGWSFNAAGPGWGGDIELVVAVDEDFGKIAGFDCLESSETAGLGDRIKQSYFRNQFAGAPVEKLTLIKDGDRDKIDNEIVAITGATISSGSVVDIINNTLLQVKEQLQKQGLIGNE